MPKFKNWTLKEDRDGLISWKHDNHTDNYNNVRVTAEGFGPTDWNVYLEEVDDGDVVNVLKMDQGISESKAKDNARDFIRENQETSIRDLVALTR